MRNAVARPFGRAISVFFLKSIRVTSKIPLGRHSRHEYQASLPKSMSKRKFVLDRVVTSAIK